MVFFFTGTGNSLYAARMLDDDCRSIPQAIHDADKTYRADRIGIVCPVYGHEVPQMVRAFIRDATFETDYFYMVLTYGKRHGGAVELAEQMLAQTGKRADYITTLLMVDNFLPGFDMEEQVRTAPEKQIDAQLARIRQDIDAKKRWTQPVTDEDRAAHQEYLSRPARITAIDPSALYRVTEDCIGCGICMKVCPAGCISVRNGRAVHENGGCQLCMACIHHCPQNAIQLTIPEKNPKARFQNEHVKLMDIVHANWQEERCICQWKTAVNA